MPRDHDIDDSTRFLLESYRKDIDKLDDKWDQYLIGMIRLEEAQKTMSTQVQKLTKLLTEDNGKPSIVTQLNNLTTTVNGIKTDLDAVRKNFGIKTPEEANLEKWKTLGKIAAATAAVGPGLVAFFHLFM